MAYRLQWLVDGRITYVAFRDIITIDELQRFVGEQHAMIAQGTQPVHHINDERAPSNFRFQLRGLQSFARSLRPPAGMGWHVEVGPPGIKRLMSALALQFARARFRQFDTLEDAITFLQQSDPTLPPIDLSVLDGTDSA